VHILVLASDPVNADTLRRVLGNDIDDARVLVVSPARNESRLAFWMSDSDEAIADADETGTETATDLRADGVAANSTTGEGEPLDAVQDALATFPADQIVIFAPAGDESQYREHDVAGEAERRFEMPVTLATV
jgi:hypothetical protein